MRYSLRYLVRKIIGENKSYNYYYNSMVEAYEKGLWNYDIRKLVKRGYVLSKYPDYIPKKHTARNICRYVTDLEEFEYQFKKYLNEYLYPRQEIRKELIVYRKAWIKKYGMITKGNQYCREAFYKCEVCKNKKACGIAKKYTENTPAMKKATRILEILYGNISAGYYAEQVID